MMTAKTHTASRQILEIIPLVMRTVSHELRQSGDNSNPAHFHVLFMLTEGPHNLSELAAKQSVSLPTMSNTVSTLVDRGWVERTRAKHDRRIVMIELTVSGQGVLEKISLKAEKKVESILSSLSDEECSQLLLGLDVLHKAFDTTMQDMPSEETD